MKYIHAQVLSLFLCASLYLASPFSISHPQPEETKPPAVIIMISRSGTAPHYKILRSRDVKSSHWCAVLVCRRGEGPTHALLLLQILQIPLALKKRDRRDAFCSFTSALTRTRTRERLVRAWRKKSTEFITIAASLNIHMQVCATLSHVRPRQQ